MAETEMMQQTALSKPVRTHRASCLVVLALLNILQISSSCCWRVPTTTLSARIYGMERVKWVTAIATVTAAATAVC